MKGFFRFLLVLFALAIPTVACGGVVTFVALEAIPIERIACNSSFVKIERRFAAFEDWSWRQKAVYESPFTGINDDGELYESAHDLLLFEAANGSNIQNLECTKNIVQYEVITGLEVQVLQQCVGTGCPEDDLRPKVVASK